MNAAAVFGHNTSGNGQPQSGAPILGREVGKEESIFILRRDAVASIGDANLDSFGFRTSASGDQDFPEGRILQSLRRIVDQVDHNTAQQPAVRTDRWQV